MIQGGLNRQSFERCSFCWRMGVRSLKKQGFLPFVVRKQAYQMLVLLVGPLYTTITSCLPTVARCPHPLNPQ
jgi:hypothetical protein